VPVFVSVTVAAGMTAWEVSITVPRTVLLLACGHAEPARRSSDDTRIPQFFMYIPLKTDLSGKTARVYQRTYIFARVNLHLCKG
jgi:hypothetical protein